MRRNRGAGELWGLLERNALRTFARRFLSPPVVMVTAACAGVLFFSDYRVANDDALIGDVASMSALPSDAAARHASGPQVVTAALVEEEPEFRLQESRKPSSHVDEVPAAEPPRPRRGGSAGNGLAIALPRGGTQRVGRGITHLPDPRPLPAVPSKPARAAEEQIASCDEHEADQTVIVEEQRGGAVPRAADSEQAAGEWYVTDEIYGPPVPAGRAAAGAPVDASASSEVAGDDSGSEAASIKWYVTDEIYGPPVPAGRAAADASVDASAPEVGGDDSGGEAASIEWYVTDEIYGPPVPAGWAAADASVDASASSEVAGDDSGGEARKSDAGAVEAAGSDAARQANDASARPADDPASAGGGEAASIEWYVTDEIYGPPVPAGWAAADASVDASASSEVAGDDAGGGEAASIEWYVTDEIYGPPLPGDWAAAGAPVDTSAPEVAGDDAGGSEAASIEWYVTDEIYGPPLPEQPVQQVEDEASHTHELPFDPLAEALSENKKSQGKKAAQNPFEQFLAEEQRDADKVEYDTVTYTREVTHRLRSGETMSEVLGAAGLSATEVDEWIRAARREYNLNRVYAGQELSIVMQMPESELQRLSLDIDRKTRLVAERSQGKVVARREQIPYERRLRAAGGTIEHSLYLSAVAQGIPDKIISEIAEILGWEVNFGALYEGATFRVVYEELSRPDTGESTAGRVLAVEVENRGRRYEGFYFATPDGSSGYYNRRGEALGRSFLRYPVAYSRISSQFSKGRFHPVLKRRVPHYGVDFAAPPGTPVRAVADGKVEKAGWYGGNGRFVKIRHDRLYETGYAHLSRIARGVRAGAHVKKGQVIGYVGSTGLATGPHLHFALYRAGKYIDPLKANLPRPRPLSGNALAGFRITVNMMERTYAKAGLGHEEETTQIATALAGETEE